MNLPEVNDELTIGCSLETECYTPWNNALEQSLGMNTK
jgi:hypothetical protein